MKQKKKILFFVSIFLSCIILMIYNSAPQELELKPAFSITDKKIIYLTFDDGPSTIVSNHILNILKQQHVKATFFVVGSMIKGKEAVLKRMYLEGHSIGLHTYSHQYNQIYASEDAFIKEMLKTSEEVKKTIGIQPNIIRFPYGSNSHLNNALLKKLHDHNFKIFDWNASISDGIRPNTSPDLFTSEAIAKGNGISYMIFLMHCNDTNINTYKALPEIIQYYKKLGYEFKPITSETPEFYWHTHN